MDDGNEIKGRKENSERQMHPNKDFKEDISSKFTG